MIAANIKEVEGRIESACRRAGRNRDEVTLIAVSKTKPVEAVREAVSCGIRVFGENKVQEMTEKIDSIQETLSWHMIGHLQRNKVKYLIGRTALIHSVDSLRLAETIEEESAKKDIITNVLIEVNIAGEDTKYGIAPEKTLELIQKISILPHISVKGLMTIAPNVEKPEENRIYFRNLRYLLIDIKSKNIDNISMEVLSMGMSGDFEIAVEEGATCIRVGTSIFGGRDYSKL